MRQHLHIVCYLALFIIMYYKWWFSPSLSTECASYWAVVTESLSSSLQQAMHHVSRLYYHERNSEWSTIRSTNMTTV